MEMVDYVFGHSKSKYYASVDHVKKLLTFSDKISDSINTNSDLLL